MPLINQVRQNRVLTNISVEYSPGMHIANEVFPRVPVAQESDIYYVYDFSGFNIPEAIRAPRSRYNQVDWSATTDTYFAQEYGLEQPIDDRERRNAVGVLNLDVDSTRNLTNNLLNSRERRITNLVLATGSYPAGHTITLAGVAQWSDPVNSDPVGDVSAARTQIQGATGLLPNTIVMGYAVFEALLVHEQIREYLAEGALVTEELLARIFRVERVIVGSVFYNTATEGQTVTLGDLWGTDVVIFHKANTSPALRTPSFGYQFVAQDFRVFQYRQDEIASDIIRVNEIVAEKMVAPRLGYLIKSAVAAA